LFRALGCGKFARMSSIPPTDENRLPRRKVLRGGLAGLAAVLMSPVLKACDSDSMSDAGGGVDARPRDAGVDGGHMGFPTRDIPSPPALRSLIADIGPLGDADANSVRLAPGFTSRVIATTRVPVQGTSHPWHTAPDGGATFATEDGGWIYVSNSETPLIGGVSAIRFDSSGVITDAYPILEGTSINCAGGKTPWHTWLSCEEAANGLVYETDPWGELGWLVRPALGVFKHEAVAVDPANGHLYLSEDEDDGNFYRFVPDAMNAAGFPDLTAGTLESAELDMDGNVTWHALPDPQRLMGTNTRRQAPTATPFDGGEGIWHHDGTIYLSTKGDTRVWAYDIAAANMQVIYDGEALMDPPPLDGVDNLTVSCCGDVLVAEDQGAMQIVAILPTGELKPIMQIVGHDGSEVTGPAFDPSGTRLYFSSQRGAGGGGITYEVSGPFHEPA